MKKDKLKIITAWIILIVLIILFLITNYVKYFHTNNSTIEEKETENSTSIAINSALTDITNNFNNDPLIERYKNEGIKIKATLNNYSIFISYYDGTNITYEFIYNKLNLNINITNQELNINKFNRIYEILLKAIQKRLNNEDNIDLIIKEHITNNKELDGITKNIDNNIIKYKINITTKIKERE